MFHLSDKELDRLSREAAEQLDVEASTSGWESLERQLQKVLPERKGRKRWFLLLLLFLSLGSGAGLSYILLHRTTQQNPSVPDSSAWNADENLQLPPGARRPPSLPDSEPMRVADASQFQKPGEAQAETQREHSNTSIKKSAKDKSEIKAMPVDDGIQSSYSTNNTRKSKELKVHESENIVSSIRRDKGMTDELSTGPFHTTQQAIARIAYNAGSISTETNCEKITLKQQHFLPEPAIAPAKDPRSRRQPEGLEIGIYASPDKSSVRFTHGDEVGISAGILAGYRLNKRITLATGVIYTKKSYTAFGSDYHPPKDYWTHNTQLHSVDGNCEMFDIPLNLRYDLNQHQKFRVFAGLGLSSYFMNKETYNYHYTYNGVYGSRVSTYRAGEGNFLSVLNLSAGIESRLNQRLYFHLEPYFKLPLGGIGFGQIRLNSYGAFIGLKYKPFQSSRP